HAEFVRYGVMHRNTFIKSPGVLGNGYELLKDPRSDGSEWVEHAWVIAETAGKTYHFDPLYGRFYAEDHSRDYFMASDETMQKTHSWDASAYPVCG
ncbi:MAG: hypothetical protein IIV87_04560, partial [Oscillospiraceae bacterium]|nr:hypothetical protein [Oscillospiraceae bacterium]